ncbi:protein-tyrosine-phosphatase IBR5-like [Gossypium australe]|uniref:Protein-tyrosine-phosphatase IBR5-like n=1 Tax=Gossypium australe TaxID=47621 RepID=A0A5B6UMU6_9ROSI|nr:protein-tyrosine-phosphatase IBR5-like [Gossypium australe]
MPSVRELEGSFWQVLTLMAYSYIIYNITLQTVPACQNLYKNSFTYHCLQDGKILLFDDAIHFLEQCERDKARVLVHCMSGKNRSPAIVVAFLLKSKGWRLPQSYQWVKERRPSVDISQAVYQQLQEYEQKLYGSSNSSNLALLSFQPGGASIFARLPPHEFTFRAGQTQRNISENLANPSGSDIPMDNT